MTDLKPNAGSEPNSVEGLTEVLRLQAEALSRISERMAAGGGKFPPPRQAGPVPEPPTREEGGHLPVRASDPVLDEDSLPVLNSFKKFLDHERRRARKRILWVLLGFTVAFSVVLAAIVWLNSEKVSALKADISQAGVQAERTRQATDAEIKALAAKAARDAAATVRSAAQGTEAVRKDVVRNVLWAHSVISSNVSAEMSGRDAEIDQLKEKLSAMEVENTLLSRQVNGLDRRVKAMESNFLDALERPLLDAEARDAERSAAAATTAATARAAAPGPLTIDSPSTGRSLRLRMPGD